ELQSLSRYNLRIHLFNSEVKKGFLSVNEILKTVNTKDKIDVYFCGPKPMRESLRKQFENSSFNLSGFHYENFQFK
ncbi:MAG: hypothetical protein PHX70_07145, partial [Clostridium sp.]|nr:hypothetical protein [Clostridium sp.]